ncbi:MAG: hypothetical protein KAS93_04630, partial [Gammaproteobacteria bacterium]|nr:hypothetical protein [Gammaproteobacteria bacterium]
TRLCEDIATILNQEEPDYMRIVAMLANHDDRVWQRFRWLATDVSWASQCKYEVSLSSYVVSMGYDRVICKKARQLQHQVRIDRNQDHNSAEHKYYQLRAFLHSDVGTSNVQYRVNEQLFAGGNYSLLDSLNLDPKPILTPEQLLRNVDRVRRNHAEISNKPKLDWSHAFIKTGGKFEQVNAGELLIVPERMASVFVLPKHRHHLRPKMRRIYRSTRELAAALAVLTAGQKRFKIQTNDTLMSEGVFNPETAIIALRHLATFVEMQNTIVKRQLATYQRRQLTKLNFMFATSNQYMAACQGELIAAHAGLLQSYAEALNYFREQYKTSLNKYSRLGFSKELLDRVETEYNELVFASDATNIAFRHKLEQVNKKLPLILQADKRCLPKSMPEITSYKQVSKRLRDVNESVDVVKRVAALEAKMPVCGQNILQRFVAGNILGFEEFALLCGNECVDKKHLQQKRFVEHKQILDRVCRKINEMQLGIVNDKYVEQAQKYFTSLNAREELIKIATETNKCAKAGVETTFLRNAGSVNNEWTDMFTCSRDKAINLARDVEQRLFDMFGLMETNVGLALCNAYKYAKQGGLQSYALAANKYTSLKSIEHGLKGVTEFQALVDCFNVALQCCRRVKNYAKAELEFLEMLEDDVAISVGELKGFSRNHGLDELERMVPSEDSNFIIN